MNKHKKFNAYVIRLRRRGLVHYAIFETVLMVKNSRRQGAIKERLGFFNPNFNERIFYLNAERLAYRVNAGAFVHNSVKKHFIKLLV